MKLKPAVEALALEKGDRLGVVLKAFPFLVDMSGRNPPRWNSVGGDFAGLVGDSTLLLKAHAEDGALIMHAFEDADVLFVFKAGRLQA